MATLLYRLGRLAFRKRRIVALVWVGLLAVAGVGAAMAPTAPDDGFSVPGTEAQRAFDLMDERFPGVKADGASARLVFAAPDGQKVTATGYKAAIDRALGELASGAQVTSVTDPFAAGGVSKDGSTGYATVSYDGKAQDLTASTTRSLADAAQEVRDTGMTVEVGGTALKESPETNPTTELIGVTVAAIVLVVTFGSLVAAGLPLLTALIGVGLGVASIAALSSTLGLSATTNKLAMMIGLAVGIDYALFIVSRYRTERAEGHDAEEAAGRAVGTAGSAVVFAGLTVVIALAGLSVVGVPMLGKMGLAAAGTVVVAVLIALTMVPALLGFFGGKVLARSARKQRRPRLKASAGSSQERGLGVRWARFVLRRPVAVLLLGVVGLGVVAVPAMDLKLALPGDEAQPTSTTQRRAYDLLSDGFGPGFNGPLTILVDAKGADDPKSAAQQVSKTITATAGVVTVSPARFNKAGDTAMITVVPATGPSTTATKELVHAIRGEADDLKAEAGAAILVSGTTAMNIDVSQKLTDALVPYLALVGGLAVLLLMVVFRSLLVPVKAALGFLLSVTAGLGVIVAVFQWGWLADLFGVEQTGPVMSMMPIFMIGVVFGLAMDYEVFLVTRIREAYVHGERPSAAIVSGFRHSSRVVAAAAFIMMAVFAGFIGMPEPMLKMMGVGLASAVAFDAFVVRMAIVPAILALVGHRAWWLPRKLERFLPRVDLEGESLSKQMPAGEPAPAEVSRV
ncbi:MMPL family transporter [Streptomyces sp. TBY4]|uniref:MMPL family transporter n=1 Tax=Streptomyces sp. TBY4 TaxID=2962030 RepID=UPI0020B8F600|nr:MMPL family transporter [Streptomyces sp. TBY4]MCP3760634.1 MMPL family transporter [Streptomyces sp. TBY4]